MAKVYLDDSARRAEEAETSRQETERLNRTNQDAILRLMNELGDLADGDLTVTATVSEDITGAIADSINYTIEELRVLVGRINDAANRVTTATEIARRQNLWRNPRPTAVVPSPSSVSANAAPRPAASSLSMRFTIAYRVVRLDRLWV